MLVNYRRVASGLNKKGSAIILVVGVKRIMVYSKEDQWRLANKVW